MIIFLLILAGVAGGLTGGMGMGGGTLLIPILTVFLHLPQKTAQCINLVSFGLIALVALWVHVKNKLVRFKTVWLMAVFAAASSLGSALFIGQISGKTLSRAFGIFLLVLAVWQTGALIFKKVQEARASKQKGL